MTTMGSCTGPRLLTPIPTSTSLRIEAMTKQAQKRNHQLRMAKKPQQRRRRTAVAAIGGDFDFRPEEVPLIAGFSPHPLPLLQDSMDLSVLCCARKFIPPRFEWTIVGGPADRSRCVIVGETPDDPLWR